MIKLSKEAWKQLNCLQEHAYTLTPFKIINSLNDDSSFKELKKELLSFFGIYHTRLQLALFKHLYGNEPQFEEQKPKKYVVKTKEPDNEGAYWFLRMNKWDVMDLGPFDKYMYKFDTREEAEQYSNPLTEVVEVEE